MGKKGVIMDNGRAAQSSMALYWKKNKEVSKHPKQKKPEEDDKEITDKSVQSNFEKWKAHKQKIISKAYTKPPKSSQTNEKKTQKDNDDEELMERLNQSKNPKIVTIPGFKSKNQLSNKLQIQKPKQADQSTNVLRFPSHMQAMSQQQIVQMLRQRKSKQQIHKRMQQHNQNTQKRQQNDRDDMMLMDEYINLKKKKQKEEGKQSIQQEIKQPEPEPSFFKSEILNKIEKQGLQKVLAPAPKIVETPIHVKQNIQIKLISQKQKQKITDQSDESLAKKNLVINQKFLPRVLKK